MKSGMKHLKSTVGAIAIVLSTLWETFKRSKFLFRTPPPKLPVQRPVP